MKQRKSFKTVYKDKAGNVLRKRFIKTRKTLQFSALNKEGKLVKHSGVMTLMRKAKKAGKL